MGSETILTLWTIKPHTYCGTPHSTGIQHLAGREGRGVSSFLVTLVSPLHLHTAPPALPQASNLTLYYAQIVSWVTENGMVWCSLWHNFSHHSYLLHSCVWRLIWLSILLNWGYWPHLCACEDMSREDLSKGRESGHYYSMGSDCNIK